MLRWEVGRVGKDNGYREALSVGVVWSQCFFDSLDGVHNHFQHIWITRDFLTAMI
jgi:hypothetical protein